MCGGLCIYQRNVSSQSFTKEYEDLFRANIQRRGPDSYDFTRHITDSGNLFMASSVLWLQGKTIHTQPSLAREPDAIENKLCYNGDIFEGSGTDYETLSTEGDTFLFYQRLCEYVCSQNEQNLMSLRGPYAYILYLPSIQKLCFARDPLGRRSLLLGINTNHNSICITSVAKRNSPFTFIELPAIGIFFYNIKSNVFEVQVYHCCSSYEEEKLTELSKFLGSDIKLIGEPLIQTPQLDNKRQIEEETNLLLLKNITQSEIAFDILLKDSTWLRLVQQLQKLLEDSVKRRVLTQPNYCQNCVQKRLNCNHATIGVLFSGGLDCTLLALMCDQFIESSRPIDLINVSFTKNNSFESPDRLTGLQTFAELKSLCPKRQWNFVPVNVSSEERALKTTDHIADLIYPLDTIMDEGLGCALWFASRAESIDYTSPCRLLVVGMGADELFGGYTKHRVALAKQSFEGLELQLKKDVENLPYRNLGRDDRVVSDHGRQMRIPYLDESVVSFVTSLKCWERTFPTQQLPPGYGDKVLLRTLAHYLGLKGAAKLKKRALQFGCWIANPKEHASSASLRLRKLPDDVVKGQEAKRQ